MNREGGEGTSEIAKIAGTAKESVIERQKNLPAAQAALRRSLTTE